MRIFIFIICIALSINCLYAVFNTPQMLNDIPQCSSFQGNEAVAFHNGILYFVYIKNQTDPLVRDLVFVKSSGNGVLQSQVITTVHDYGINRINSDGSFTTFDKSVPTILVNDAHIIITFHDQDKIYTAVSTDEGNQFLITEADQGFDPMPLTKEYNGQYYLYNANQDPTGDSLYTTFTDTFLTENEGMGTDTGIEALGGNDHLSGPFRTNTDLWIQHTETGNANPLAPGWPVFYSPVYTSGTIQSLSPNPPLNLIFRAGYYEHVPPLDIFATVSNDLAEGPWFPLPYSQNTICLVRVHGTSYTSWIGYIIQNGFDTLSVYANYPPNPGELPIATNVIAHIDTVWTQGPIGSVLNGTIYCQNKLWIEGVFSGNQTWACEDTISIIGDILLSGTQVGHDPGNNHTDHVNLVSEQSIHIKYGFQDPDDSLRYHKTCGSDGFGPGTGVWIYASLMTMGNGEGNHHKDGVFSFEYQQPHISTQDTTVNDSLYDLIDLHRHIFPPTVSNPWLGNLDYPWYNPLWPESSPYLERGYIHLYGSLYQRRIGFLHRNLYDQANHQTGAWDINTYQYGSICSGQNYPGATGNGIGYKKDFHPDRPLANHTYPFGNNINVLTSTNLQDWTGNNQFSAGYATKTKTFQFNGDFRLLTLNKQIFIKHQNFASHYNLDNIVNGNIYKSYIEPTNITMLTSTDNTSDEMETLQVSKLYLPYTPDFPQSTFFVKLQLPVKGHLFDFLKNDVDLSLLASTDSTGVVKFYRQAANDEYTSDESWNPGLNLSSVEFDHEMSRLVLIPISPDSMYVLFFLKPISSDGAFYLAKGQMSVVSDQDEIAQPLEIGITTYPNPFSNEMKVDVNINKALSSKIEIFNLRGQLIKSISSNEVLSKGNHTLSWDGKDNKGQSVASGIYFLKAEIGDKTLTRKILRLK